MYQFLVLSNRQAKGKHSMTRKRQMKQAIERVLAQYGFDAGQADSVANKILAEIYNLIPARTTTSASRETPDMPQSVKLFHDVTGFWPSSPAWKNIDDLMAGKTLPELQEAYTAWCFNGRDKNSAGWLKWVKSQQTQNTIMVR
jgi:hypothetical protein